MVITIVVTPRRDNETSENLTLNCIHSGCENKPFEIHRNPATGIYMLRCPVCSLEIEFFGEQSGLFDLEHTAIDSKDREITTGFRCSLNITQIKIVSGETK